MKKILLLIFMMMSLLSFSQTIDMSLPQSDSTYYPLVTTDSIGNKIVILTIEQAKYVDNQLDILNLLQESSDLINDIDSVCVKVINEKDDIIAKQDIKISKMDSLLVNRDEQIDNLKQQILVYQMSEMTYIQELQNKDSEIELHLDRISDLEKKTLWGGVAGGVIITALVTLLIAK